MAADVSLVCTCGAGASASKEASLSGAIFFRLTTCTTSVRLSNGHHALHKALLHVKHMRPASCGAVKVQLCRMHLGLLLPPD